MDQLDRLRRESGVEFVVGTAFGISIALPKTLYGSERNV
jgi:hypothetical protein